MLQSCSSFSSVSFSYQGRGVRRDWIRCERKVPISVLELESALSRSRRLTEYDDPG